MKDLFAQMVINDAVAQVALTAIAAGVGWTLRKVSRLAEDVARIKEHLDLK